MVDCQVVLTKTQVCISKVGRGHIMRLRPLLHFSQNHARFFSAAGNPVGKAELSTKERVALSRNCHRPLQLRNAIRSLAKHYVSPAK